MRRLGAWERDLRDTWARATDAGTWPELRASSWVLWDRVIGRRHVEAFLRGEDRAWLRGRREIGDPAVVGSGRGLAAADLAARDEEIWRLLATLQAWIDRWPRRGRAAIPVDLTYPERVGIRGALVELECGRPVLEASAASVPYQTPPEVARRELVARRVDRRIDGLLAIVREEAAGREVARARRHLGWAGWITQHLVGIDVERVLVRSRADESGG